VEEGTAVDFYHEGSLVCWTDSGLEMIQCVSYNGTNTGTKVSFFIVVLFYSCLCTITHLIIASVEH